MATKTKPAPRFELNVTDVFEQVREAENAIDLKEIITGLMHTCGPAVTVRVMKQCGRQCVHDQTVARAKAFYAKADNLEEFVTMLNAAGIGGRDLHVRQGAIVAVFKTCSCNLSRKAQGVCALYCYSLAGWYEELFSRVFNRPVNARLLSSIIGGAERCEFEIQFQ